MGAVDAGKSVKNFQLKESGEDLCDRRQIAGLCLLLILLMRLQALFRQLWKRCCQHADSDHDQGHDRLDGDGRGNREQEAADLKIDLAQRRDIILLDGVDVVLNERKVRAVILFCFFRIAERFYFPHSIGAEAAPDALDDDIARIVQQESKKCLNAEVKQRHKRDFPHAREITLHGAVGKRAKQKGHEHGRTGRQKVGHKKQRNR